jgi:hypothetical protein
MSATARVRDLDMRLILPREFSYKQRGFPDADDFMVAVSYAQGFGHLKPGQSAIATWRRPLGPLTVIDNAWGGSGIRSRLDTRGRPSIP